MWQFVPAGKFQLETQVSDEVNLRYIRLDYVIHVKRIAHRLRHRRKKDFRIHRRNPNRKEVDGVNGDE